MRQQKREQDRCTCGETVRHLERDTDTRSETDGYMQSDTVRHLEKAMQRDVRTLTRRRIKSETDGYMQEKTWSEPFGERHIGRLIVRHKG